MLEISKYTPTQKSKAREIIRALSYWDKESVIEEQKQKGVGIDDFEGDYDLDVEKQKDADYSTTKRTIENQLGDFYQKGYHTQYASQKAYNSMKRYSKKGTNVGDHIITKAVLAQEIINQHKRRLLNNEKLFTESELCNLLANKWLNTIVVTNKENTELAKEVHRNNMSAGDCANLYHYQNLQIKLVECPDLIKSVMGGKMNKIESEVMYMLTEKKTNRKRYGQGYIDKWKKVGKKWVQEKHYLSMKPTKNFW